MTGSRFVGITPWPGGEQEKAYIVCSETGFSFGCFEWRCVEVFLKPAQAKSLVLRSMACRLESMWSQDKSICKVCTRFVYVLIIDVVRLGVVPWRGCKF